VKVGILKGRQPQYNDERERMRWVHILSFFPIFLSFLFAEDPTNRRDTYLKSQVSLLEETVEETVPASAPIPRESFLGSGRAAMEHFTSSAQLLRAH